MAAPITPIDLGWNYQPAVETAKFRAQDVELLLDQAADHLDRILRDRAEFDALGEKQFDIEALLQEAEAYNSVRPVSLATPENVDGKSKAEEPIKLKKEEKRLADWPEEADKEQINSLEGQLGYLYVKRENCAQTRKQFSTDYDSQATFAGQAGATESKSNNEAVKALSELRRYDLKMQDQLNSLQQNAVFCEQHATLYAARAAEIRAVFNQAVATLTESLRKDRLTAAKEAGNPLNFTERRHAIQARMNNDFEAAKARVEKARIGLKEIYGYPEGKTPEPPEAGALGVYDNYLIWVRQAISYLTAVLRLDQRFIIPVSIKRGVRFVKGDGNWADGLKVGKWTFQIEPLKVGFPPHYRLTRLRGVSLSLVANDKVQPIDGWTGELEVDRGSLNTKVFMSRIQPRQPLREPDIFGGTLLYNIDPFSRNTVDCTWTLEIDQESLLGQKLADVVNDLWLELHIVAQE